MSFTGLIIGICAFLMIGIFHPIIIKCEYHFSDRVWPVFLIVGIVSVAVSCFIQHTVASAVLAIFGCSSLWSIIELKEQKKRVEKGWFPENPARSSPQKRSNEERYL
ncbi:MAG: DUF4491 family protein [Christensenellales bacterium]|jgi:hypothetical protein